MKRERDKKERGWNDGEKTERESVFRAKITRQIMMKITDDKKIKNQCIKLPVWRSRIQKNEAM